MDPSPSLLEPPTDSSPLVDPCSSRQELDAKRLEPARVESKLGSSRLGLEAPPGLKDSSRLGSCTTLVPAKLAHEAQQVLSAAEEEAIATWIKKWADFGFPPRRRHVYQMVQGLL